MTIPPDNLRIQTSETLRASSSGSGLAELNSSRAPRKSRSKARTEPQRERSLEELEGTLAVVQPLSVPSWAGALPSSSDARVPWPHRCPASPAQSTRGGGEKGIL